MEVLGLTVVIAESTNGQSLGAFLLMNDQGGDGDDGDLDNGMLLAQMPLSIAEDAPAVLLAFREFARCCADAYLSTRLDLQVVSVYYADDPRRNR